MIIDVANNAERALRMVREAKFLSYDTETTGLDWRVNVPIGYVVGAPRAATPPPDGAEGGTVGVWRGIGIAQQDVVYVPVRHGGGGNLMGGRPMTEPDGEWQVHDFEIALAKAFAERDEKWQDPEREDRVVGHHIKFDAHFSANAGIMLGHRLADTQDIAALLDEYRRSFSLSAVSESFGVEAKKGEELYTHLAKLFGGADNKKQMGNYWRLSGVDPLGYEYAVGDGVSTMQAYFEARKAVEKEGIEVVMELESDLIWTVFRMERKGTKVDKDAITVLKRKTEQEIERMVNGIHVGFNVNSPKMLKAYFDDVGETGYPITEKGNPSFAERWLKTTEAGRKIIDIRRAITLVNSFITPLEERHMFKGRVHPTLNQLKSDDKGTISGRFSCNNPNLQQVPKRDKSLAIPFRKLFIPDDDMIFWERDWSQCEPRLFAHYSGDANLTEGYNAKPFRDAHQVVADLLNVERDPTAKRMNMGIFTGMQAQSFAGHMNWDLDRATKAHRAWFNEFPEVRAFQNKAKARLLNRGFVYTLLGRKCRLEDRRFAYRGTSKIIQGSNADIVKYKLLEMDRLCEENGDIVQILMTVHDSFNGQREDTPEAKALLAQLDVIMEDVQGAPFNLRVPFVSEGFEGPDWAVASFGSETVAKIEAKA